MYKDHRESFGQAGYQNSMDKKNKNSDLNIFTRKRRSNSSIFVNKN